MARIVANLREFAQLDRGRLTEIHVNAALDQVLELLGGHLERLRIEVVRDYAALPAVECATASVNEVFFQIVTNAVHAIEDGGKASGRIRLVTRAVDGEVCIEIIDDGCGIPPEVLPRVFDPFFTTKRVGRGAGLGLSTSHGVVSSHGGRIEVESVPGEGSLVRVRLPVGGTPPS